MIPENGAPMPGLVSVVTPCYNAAAFVLETLAAVQAQSYVAVEHIVVDDASTDGSWELVRGAANVHTVRLEHNCGGAYARSVGVRHARGEYLMFLDADDLLAPDTLAALVATLQARPDAIAVCPWSRLRRHASGAWVRTAADVPLPCQGADHLREWIDNTCWVPTCSVLWHRSVYAATGGWDETLTLDDDADLMMRALLDGVALAVADGGESYYRDHGTSLVSVSKNLFSAKPLESRVRILDKLAAALAARGALPRYAVALGAAYQRAAMAGYQQGWIALGRACQSRGEALAGPQPVSRTRAGRALCAILGLERKERVVRALAACGLGPRWRRDLTRLRAAQ
jgi:O-antigen biosynthesis protein